MFNDIRPVDEDILLIKLAPSQKIHAELFCQKGIGKDHAKYCPVSACFYCFLTEFYFTENSSLNKEELEQLKLFFPKGFIDYEQINENGYPKIINNRFNKSDFIFQTCPSLREKIIFKTNSNILSCKFIINFTKIFTVCITNQFHFSYG